MIVQNPGNSKKEGLTESKTSLILGADMAMEPSSNDGRKGDHGEEENCNREHSFIDLGKTRGISIFLLMCLFGKPGGDKLRISCFLHGLKDCA